jgi:hypothetical protein
MSLIVLIIFSSGYQEESEDDEEESDDDDKDGDGDMFPSDEEQEEGTSFKHFSKDDSSSDAQKGACVKNQLCKNNYKLLELIHILLKYFLHCSNLGQFT